MRVPGSCSPPDRCCPMNMGIWRWTGRQRGDAAGDRAGVLRDADIHWGYGFPLPVWPPPTSTIVGSSPRGVGFDISCGVRLLVSRELDREQLTGSAR